MRLIVTVLAVIFVVACSGTRVATRQASQLIPEYTYRLNEELFSSVGEPMTASSPLIRADVLVFSEELVGETAHRDKPVTVRAPSDSYTMVAQDQSGYFYQSDSGRVNMNGRVQYGGLYLPRHDGPEKLFWHHLSFDEYFPLDVYMAPVTEPLEPESVMEAVFVPPGFYDGLVSTLSYIGMSRDEIRFVYREFNDGLARPAFTQQVEFDYKPGGIYAYQSAQLVVHEANPEGIRYTLLSPL